MSSIMRLIEQLHAWCSISCEFGSPIDQIPHRKLNRVLTFYEPGAGLPPPRIAKPPTEEEKKDPDRRPEYWSVTCGGLTEFTGIRCRNVDANFEAFTVATRVGMGLSDRPHGSPTPFRREVQTRLQLSDAIAELSDPYTLPLESKFHFQTWTVHSTRVDGGGGNRLWPVPGQLDYAVVHVFVFDVQKDGSVTPMAVDDYADRADLANLLRACRRYSPGAKKAVVQDDAAPVSQDLFKDDLFRSGGNIATVEVGRETAVKTVPTRIAVAITLTCYRQTGDYQPAGPFPRTAGAARFWPVVQVVSTKRIAELRASIEFDRPSTSEWDASRGCHGSREISSMLVADTNAGARLGTPSQSAPAANWSSLFNYYVTNAEQDIGLNNEIHMVRAWKPEYRSDNSSVLRRSPGAEDQVSRSLYKCARQGEFDNVHMSPKMSLVDAKFAMVHENLANLGWGIGPALTTTPVLVDLSDRARFKLDNLSMAPFCAHDCLHMHWRWTDAGPDSAQLGFEGYEPNMKPGAPMVPDAQDVYVWFRARGWLTYHAEHADEEGAPVAQWVPVLHHGAAYLTDSNTAAITAAQLDVNRRSRVRFLRSNNEFDVVTIPSWAAFYWNIRYYMEKDVLGNYRAVERTTPSDAAGLLGPRKL